MGTNLVHLESQQSIEQAVQAGGLGLSSKFFQIKPATLELVQKTTRTEGAVIGKLRVKETNEHFDTMHLVLLGEPQEKRTCYPPGAPFGASPLCFSMNGLQPHENAEHKQALNCANCKMNDWNAWKKGGRKRELLPPCKNRLEIPVVDRKTKLPYWLVVNGKSLSEALQACGQIGRLMQSVYAEEGKLPNFFDFSFKATPVHQQDNSGTYYVLKFTEIAQIREEDRAEFGKQFVNFYNAQQARQIAAAVVTDEREFDEAVTAPDTGSDAGSDAPPVATYDNAPITGGTIQI